MIKATQSAGKRQPRTFCFDHGTLVNVYKAKLADHLRQLAACTIRFQLRPGRRQFVVDIQPVGDGQAVLKYLAPYVHRVAISDSRIVACDESSVTFRYRAIGDARGEATPCSR